MAFFRPKHVSDEDMSLLIDGRLEGKRRAWVEAHLQACASCRARYEATRQTVHLVQALPRVAVPRAFTLSEAEVARRRRASGWTWDRWAMALVAVLLAFVISLDVVVNTLFPPVAAPPPPIAVTEVVEAPMRAMVKGALPTITPVSTLRPLARAPEAQVEALPTPRLSAPLATVEATVEMAERRPSSTPAVAPRPRAWPWYRWAEVGLAALFVALIVTRWRRRGGGRA